MNKFKYNLGSNVIINKNAEAYVPSKVNTVGEIIAHLEGSSPYDYKVRFEDGGEGNFNEVELNSVVYESNNTYEQQASKLGKLVDEKQAAYGDSVSSTIDLMQVFLKKYKNDDNTYTIPESLLTHILLQVRIIDKQNRIFSNPDGDLMEESPYKDIAGYGLLGNSLSKGNSKT